MTDDEIRKQNRETLLSRIAAWGKYDDYEQPIGLLDEAAEEIKRLRAELVTALAERDEAKGTITRMRDGYEGCCPLCETVGILNVKLLAERDAARRDVCYAEVNGQYGRRYTPQDIAKIKNWDCFPD